MQKKAKLENKSLSQNLLNSNSNGSDSDCISNDKNDTCIKEQKSTYFLYFPLYLYRFTFGDLNERDWKENFKI